MIIFKHDLDRRMEDLKGRCRKPKYLGINRIKAEGSTAD